MSDERVLEGGCPCGAVRFAAHGEPENVAVCHCRRCQQATGGPFFARALYRQRQVRVSGATERYASSPDLWRVVCRSCRAPLFGARQDGGSIGIALAAFDDQTALAPTHHFFVESKAPWLTLNDGLPHYAEWAPD